MIICRRLGPWPSLPGCQVAARRRDARSASAPALMRSHVAHVSSSTASGALRLRGARVRVEEVGGVCEASPFAEGACGVRDWLSRWRCPSVARSVRDAPGNCAPTPFVLALERSCWGRDEWSCAASCPPGCCACALAGCGADGGIGCRIQSENAGGGPIPLSGALGSASGVAAGM